MISCGGVSCQLKRNGSTFRGDKFCLIAFASLLKIGSTFKGSKGIEFFHLRVDPISEVNCANRKSQKSSSLYTIVENVQNVFITLKTIISERQLSMFAFKLMVFQNNKAKIIALLCLLVN